MNSRIRRPEYVLFTSEWVLNFASQRSHCSRPFPPWWKGIGNIFELAKRETRYVEVDPGRYIVIDEGSKDPRRPLATLCNYHFALGHVCWCTRYRISVHECMYVYVYVWSYASMYSGSRWSYSRGSAFWTVDDVFLSRRIGTFTLLV